MKRTETDVLYESTLADDSTSQLSFFTQYLKTKIGAVLVALFIAIAAVVFAAAYEGYLPRNMIGGFAVIMTLGFLLAHIGHTIPVFKDIGGPAILCLMVPSILVYFYLFNDKTMKTVHLLMKEANFLYFVIACLVVGSILDMNRNILIQAMVRMFVPLVIGTRHRGGKGPAGR